MNKYERNIKQIRDRGESAEMYFLDKTKEELMELCAEVENLKYDHRRAIEMTDNIYEEIADVLNCIIYLIILFKLDIFKIIRIMFQKVDRGYERGEVADEKV